MNNKKLLALYGLQWNPFLPDIPATALWSAPGMDHFFFRIENLVSTGGFGLVCGEPGLGKSKILQGTADRLKELGDLVVGVMERPQSSLSDFYRELGSLFDVDLTPANRYGGFKALRQKWHNHIRSTLFRPVLLVDEAQEMSSPCLNELRMLGSAAFDSRCLLTTIICGDLRLLERFRETALVSLGSRIRVRMNLKPYDRDSLTDYMQHAIEQAGAPHLMTPKLISTIADHCGGNLRIMNTIAAELLEEGTHREVSQLDEKLYLTIYSRNSSSRPPVSRK